MPKLQVTVRLDKERLNRAKKLLRAETVTDTIEQALSLATEKTTHDAILRKYSGVGKKGSFAGR